MKKVVSLAIITLLAATPAMALDLQGARASGVVAEQVTGYLKATKPAPDVDALVADVNAKRKVEYERIAKEKGQPVDEVAKVAGQELIKR